MSIYNKFLISDLMVIVSVALLSLFTPIFDTNPFLEKSLFIVLSAGALLLLLMEHTKHKDPYSHSHWNTMETKN